MAQAQKTEKAGIQRNIHGQHEENTQGKLPETLTHEGVKTI